MSSSFKRPCGLIAAMAAAMAFTAPGAFADSAGVTFSQGDTFTEKDGAALYANVCAACHLDKGQGAVGAGHYPALAKNKNLETGGYPVSLVLHGQNGMPPVGQMMSDDQVAAVVNYVRTHFGNDYKDAVTAQDVKDVR
ncbi:MULTISPECIES: cytochrome c [unclassified Mesorhizobium]|uniref:c-type cytochrome n=1 Tax=unclassified Mesorhizobium TaxID=325217 RepID=UPI001126A50A|nr:MULTISPECIES: cytochrome c [unclassified Mesorhizobium]MBZ9703799.1 cytochrome c [Mesorhizobium sp. CO1-1-3]MBZ9947452.1 cytochrome c [Mesorhizobium sp. BR1-1-11]MBZ9953486.1 cytochrome c [Mesorhizobium sp. BR1-1-15]MCA0026132.1 cytochrome c [Mesorhizobium sp. B263B1A]MCA0059760.1 cytochrome c [Mesorhizobium sp. B261B1A]